MIDMKKIQLSILCLFTSFILSAQKLDFITHYEKSGFLETPRYTETLEFFRHLAKISPNVHIQSFGQSPQGRELPLVIVDKDGLANPAQIRAKGRAIVLIEACIHAGEPEGKDAGMLLIRDMVIHKKAAYLLDNVSLLFIPIFNVDGHERFGKYNRINQNGPTEMGWRTTAQNLNLNRDFLKAEAPEMQCWLKMFNSWMPDFFVDSHTTDGADYQYAITYELETTGNMDDGLTRWQKEIYLKQVEKTMITAGYPMIPYVTFRNWHDPRSGLIINSAPPMLSQGYTAQRNRPGLLIETHMLKNYKTRVEATYALFKATMETVGKNSTSLRKAIEKADNYCASEEFRTKYFPVSWETSQKDSTSIDFQGVEYEGIKSDLTGGTWFQYSKKPKTFKITYFDQSLPSDSVKLPYAYIIPAEWINIIQKLDLHDIKYKLLTKSQTLKVSTYKFQNVKLRAGSYEGRQTANFDCQEIQAEREFAIGSAVVMVNQPTARIIAYLLEPKAESSLAFWGYFNSIFEQKEYSESYVMERVAREMLAKNPALKAEYEKKMSEDKDFSQNPYAQYNWFYAKSPWWDDRKDIYPIGKIYDKELIIKL
jgi:hypothetical protein